VFRPVLKHVDKGVSDLARRPQRVRVKPVAEDATTPPQDPIHGLRDANGQSLKPARKHAAIDRLHEQVQMVALHREVQYAQAAARGLRQSASDGGEEWLRA